MCLLVPMSDRLRLPVMGWSGRAPAPPANEAGKGHQRQGARHISNTQYRYRRDWHRYRQELVPRRGPRYARRHRAAAKVVAWPSGSAARQYTALPDRHACALISMVTRSKSSNRRPDTLMLDRKPTTRRKPLATRGRTMHMRQMLPKWLVLATSAFPSRATAWRTSRLAASCQRTKSLRESPLRG